MIFDTSGFGGLDDGISLFTTDNQQFRMMIRYTSSRWSAFVRSWWAGSEGSNRLVGDATGVVHNTRIDQDYTDGELGLTYTLRSGIYVGGAWRTFEYEDMGNQLLDYDGNIITLRAGFVFGRPRS